MSNNRNPNLNQSHSRGQSLPESLTARLPPDQASRYIRSFTDPFQTAAASLFRFEDQSRIAQPGHGRRAEYGIIAGGRVIPASVSQSLLATASLPSHSQQSSSNPIPIFLPPQSTSPAYALHSSHHRQPPAIASTSTASFSGDGIPLPLSTSANISIHRNSPTPRMVQVQGQNDSRHSALSGAIASATPSPIRRVLKRKSSIPSFPPTMARVNLDREAKSLEVDGLEKGCYASPSLGELLEWTVAIEGPRGTPYEGGVFFVQLTASQEHPVFPPRAAFLTRIYHLNVGIKGDISKSVISDQWNKNSNKMKDAIHAIKQMLIEPKLDDPVNEPLAVEYKLQPQKYEETARIWTQRYAR